MRSLKTLTMLMGCAVFLPHFAFAGNDGGMGDPASPQAAHSPANYPFYSAYHYYDDDARESDAENPMDEYYAYVPAAVTAPGPNSGNSDGNQAGGVSGEGINTDSNPTGESGNNDDGDNGNVAPCPAPPPCPAPDENRVDDGDDDDPSQYGYPADGGYGPDYGYPNNYALVGVDTGYPFSYVYAGYPGGCYFYPSCFPGGCSFFGNWNANYNSYYHNYSHRDHGYEI